METSCRCCQSLLPKLKKGSAPIRPDYVQPTRYHHMQDFAKYNKKEEMKKKLRENAIILLKKNSKFINFDIDLDKLAEMMQAFNTDELNQLKKNTKSVKYKSDEESACSMSKNYGDPKFTSKSPLICPLEYCGETVGTSSVLAHFLCNHQRRVSTLSYRVIRRYECIQMKISDRYLKLENLTSLGLLVYGPEWGDGDSLGQSLLCRPNIFLPKKYTHYVYHLPIIAFALKTSLANFLEDEELAKQLYNSTDDSAHVLVIWIATVETSRPIFSTLTVCDKRSLICKSTVVKARNLRDTQESQKFLSKDTNYLCISRGELNQLTHFGESNFLLDICIYDKTE